MAIMTWSIPSVRPFGFCTSDHPLADAVAMAGPVPQAIIQAGQLGTIAKGGPPRLILFNARTLNELMCRPQSDRLVIDRGRRVFAELPDYGELDGV
jgi:cytosine deaminase